MPKGTGWIVEAAVVANCFGLMCAYLVVFSTLMVDLFETSAGDAALRNRLFWVTVGIVLVTPMAFCPTLDSLRFTSALGMVFVIYLALLIYSYFLSGHEMCSDDGIADQKHCGAEFLPANWGINVLHTISTTTFAFTCHIQVAYYYYSSSLILCVCG